LLAASADTRSSYGERKAVDKRCAGTNQTKEQCQTSAIRAFFLLAFISVLTGVHNALLLLMSYADDPQNNHSFDREVEISVETIFVGGFFKRKS